MRTTAGWLRQRVTGVYFASEGNRVIKKNTRKAKAKSFTKKKIAGTSFQRKIDKANELLERAVLMNKQSATQH